MLEAIEFNTERPLQKGVYNLTSSLLCPQSEQGYFPEDTQNAAGKLEKVRDLIISYAGLTLQEPEMFPQPTVSRPLGAAELVEPLLSISAFSAPLLSGPSTSPNRLAPTDVDQFLQDIARRFEPDDELEGVLGPVVRQLLFHPSLFRPEGLGGGDSGWRSVIGGLEALVSVKPIAIMITKMEDWNPPAATAYNFEITSLMGPLCRLGVFPREWPGIAKSYFSEPEKRSRNDIESSYSSLRGTLKSLQVYGVLLSNELRCLSLLSSRHYTGYSIRWLELLRNRENQCWTISLGL